MKRSPRAIPGTAHEYHWCGSVDFGDLLPNLGEGNRLALGKVAGHVLGLTAHINHRNVPMLEEGLYRLWRMFAQPRNGHDLAHNKPQGQRRNDPVGSHTIPPQQYFANPICYDV